ncbi:MAG TPA: hypothetical protein VNX60_13805 [Candidatus Acidoferrum sp.]|nr:hypothetical protein [Candidatus Acidoferrum sp.]
MSEERRKRQEEQGGSREGKTKKTLIYGGVLILLAGAFIAGRHYRDHKYDSFAQCLASKQAKMYGLYWCPHCIEQKEMFAQSFHYVPYVECAIKGSKEEAPECKVAGVKLFPSWQFGGEPPREGVLSLEALSDKTGCSLP